jgi:hypothetical protein
MPAGGTRRRPEATASDPEPSGEQHTDTWCNTFVAADDDVCMHCGEEDWEPGLCPMTVLRWVKAASAFAGQHSPPVHNNNFKAHKAVLHAHDCRCSCCNVKSMHIKCHAAAVPGAANLLEELQQEPDRPVMCSEV